MDSSHIRVSQNVRKSRSGFLRGNECDGDLNSSARPRVSNRTCQTFEHTELCSTIESSLSVGRISDCEVRF